jgi:hypothetical protein
MAWSTWVSTPEAHARASARRGYNKQRQEAVRARRLEIQRLTVRWGTSAAAKVKLARYFRVSLRTIARDLQAMQEDPVLPALCPLCGLPTDLTADPTTLTDDPQALARLEAAMSRLVGADDDQARTPRLHLRPAHPTRLQGDERSTPRARALGETAAHAWG